MSETKFIDIEIGTSLHVIVRNIHSTIIELGFGLTQM